MSRVLPHLIVQPYGILPTSEKNDDENEGEMFERSWICMQEESAAR